MGHTIYSHHSMSSTRSFLVITEMSHQCHYASNHQPLQCWFNYLSSITLKKISKLLITSPLWGESIGALCERNPLTTSIKALNYWPLCEGNPPVPADSPHKGASNVERFSMPWRLHGIFTNGSRKAVRDRSCNWHVIRANYHVLTSSAKGEMDNLFKLLKYVKLRNEQPFKITSIMIYEICLQVEEMNNLSELLPS